METSLTETSVKVNVSADCDLKVAYKSRNPPCEVVICDRESF